MSAKKVPILVIHVVTVPVIEPPTEVIVEDVDGEKEKVEGEEEVPDGTASRTSKIDDAGSVHKEEDPPAEVRLSPSHVCLATHAVLPPKTAYLFYKSMCWST